MDPSTTQAHIRELESVRKQINLWRLGVTLIVAGTLVVSIWTLYRDAKGLATQGSPAQEQFVTQLQQRMNERVVPQLKEAVGNTLTEMHPVVQAEFIKLNERVPDITQASLKQMEELQVSLPKRGEKVLDETFGEALRGEEPEIRKMFPDATEEQVKGLVTALVAAVNERGPSLANELLSPHVSAMNGIHSHLKTIQATDRMSASERDDDWGMGLAVFDVMRDDLKDLTLPKSKAAAMVAEAAGHVSDTAKEVSKTADDIARKAKEEGSK